MEGPSLGAPPLALSSPKAGAAFPPAAPMTPSGSNRRASTIFSRGDSGDRPSLLTSLSSGALTAKRRASNFADLFRPGSFRESEVPLDSPEDGGEAPSSAAAVGSPQAPAPSALAADPHDQKPRHPVFAQLSAAGYNALKAMGASRAARMPDNISTPYNVVHTAHVVFDPKSLAYQGLPEEWQKTDTSTYSQFGCSITSCPRVAVPGFKERIPAVLVQLRDELSKHNGLHVEGVFRTAASFGDQKAYKLQMDTGTFAGCKTNEDTQCMAGLLKDWFRTMPVRLLNILSIEALRKGECNIETDLPEPNLSVFKWLLDLMAETVSYEEHNRMTVKAIAIVMAPNLYSSGEGAQPMDVVQEMQGAVRIVEAALMEWIKTHPQTNNVN